MFKTNEIPIYDFPQLCNNSVLFCLVSPHITVHLKHMWEMWVECVQVETVLIIERVSYNRKTEMMNRRFDSPNVQAINPHDFCHIGTVKGLCLSP